MTDPKLRKPAGFGIYAQVEEVSSVKRFVVRHLIIRSHKFGLKNYREINNENIFHRYNPENPEIQSEA